MAGYLLYISYFLLGSLAGLLSGLLGVGGGVVVVPGFIWLFQLHHIPSQIIMQMAAGTSLGAMIVTATVSAYTHYRLGANFGKILYKMIPGLVVGTGCGVVLAYFLSSQGLKMIFGVLLLGVSLKDFFGHVSAETARVKQVKTYLIALASTTIGILSGMLGVGGGTLIIPFLEYCGIGIKRATSISTVCGLVVSLTGTVCFIVMGAHDSLLPRNSIGYVYLPAALAISISSPIFAVLGSHLHRYISVNLLKRIFSVFLMVVAIRLLT